MTELFNRITEAFGTENGAEIGRQLELSKNLVYRWRDAKGIPTSETFLKIFERTGVSLHWLMTGEGEKFLSENVTNVTKSLDSRTAAVDNPRALKTIPGIIGLPTAQITVQGLPLHATIFSDSQTIVPSKEEIIVAVPGVLLSPETLLFLVEGDGWTMEGLHDGDMLLARPITGDPQGKLVIALVDGKATCRNYEKRGNWILFSALDGNQPSFRVPASTVEVLYEISSLIHNFKH